MADWQELVNTCVISLIFAAMLAKLISLLVSFRKENLRIERQVESIHETQAIDTGTPPMELHAAKQSVGTGAYGVEPAKSELSVEDSDVRTPGEASKAENQPGGSVGSMGSSTDESIHDMDRDKLDEESLLSDDEDWEGIDGSDLVITFGKAASFLEGLVLDPSVKVSNDLKLKFYGLYKQATEGPCSTPQPPAFRPTARTKWNSWKTLGNLSQEEGMQRYIELLSELYPSWNQTTKDKDMAESSHKHSSIGSKETRGMGPVFSTMMKDSSDQEGLEEVHLFAKNGDITGLEGLLKSNIPIDQKDTDGRTPLHWAADQGHLDIVKLLISWGAQINVKDSDGQTALHYAVTCEWEDVAKFLLENGADPFLMDNDGCTPYVSGAEYSASKDN